MKWFMRGVGRVNDFGFVVASVAVLVVMLVMFADTMGRYFFSRPLEWGHEFVTFVFAMLVFFCGGWVLKEGGHVKVDVVYNRFSPRTRAIIDCFTSFFLFLFCFVLVKYGWEKAWYSFEFGALSHINAWPLFPFHLLVPLGGFLLGAQGLHRFFQNLAVAKQRGKDAR